MTVMEAPLDCLVQVMEVKEAVEETVQRMVKPSPSLTTKGSGSFGVMVISTGVGGADRKKRRGREKGKEGLYKNSDKVH